MDQGLQNQINELKETVRLAVAHPFLPSPARLAIAQACSVIELIATELQKISEMLVDELQVREARLQSRF